ncbi:MAG: hypothetical protein KME60_03285 [Cyanomargarita calcarea GSE-NOS-MK-12-04C]|uniref:Uncharacterized protein n=1 Tax=Cyanomargarita calcarea GSE-NOS-MK-12-04C TaxID=2839659 RepID=A0A951UQY5_9CYAN|nr:hypothetical protein [Cyanomargarita calcarea GSE-NOS-MK-12-04C]
MTKAHNYASALKTINIALPVNLVDELLGLIDQFVKSKNIRRNEKGDYSIYDFLAYVCKKINPSIPWKRFGKQNPAVLTKCSFCQFPGERQSRTPVCSKFHLIVIAYLMPGEYGDRLRKASANLICEVLEQYPIAKLESILALDTVPGDKPGYPYSDIDLHQFTGYASLDYTRKVIRKDYIKGADYIKLQGRYYLTAEATAITCRVARPENGSTIPDEVWYYPVTREKAQQQQQNSKINRRRSQQDDSNQLSLF